MSKKNSMPLYMQITRWLLQAMEEGIYADVERLPPEVDIAVQLGVSRTAVRDALSTLEREGFVTRRHGKGTSINRHVLRVKTRIDLEEEFLDSISATGRRPSVNFVRIAQSAATPEQARWLDMEGGSEVVCVDRLVSADDLPAIYCADMFDRRLIGSRPYTMEDLQTPIFDFLHRFCGIDIYMDLTEINAVNADETLSDMLKVPKGTALLHLDERGYTLDGQLVLYSSEYYRNGILNHTILRKKI